MRINLLKILGIAIALAILIGACSKRAPLDSVVQAPATVNGQIRVMTLNGVTLIGGVAVELVCPSGASSTLPSSGVPPNVGYAFFPVSASGSYRVGLANQPASTPAFQSVEITESKPYADVSLQTTGAFLSVTIADGSPQSFTSNIGAHAYTLSYTNTTDNQQDLVIVTGGGLPTGWAVSVLNNTLKAGQSTTLYVYTGQFTASSSVTIPINGYVGTDQTFSTSITLYRNWTVNLITNLQFGYTGSSACPSHYICTVNGSYQLTGVNISAANLNLISARVVITSMTMFSPPGQNCGGISVTLPYTVNLNGASASAAFQQGSVSDWPNWSSATITGNIYYTINGVPLLTPVSFTHGLTYTDYNWHSATSPGF